MAAKKKKAKEEIENRQPVYYRFTSEFLNSPWFVLGADKKYRVLIEVYKPDTEGDIVISTIEPVNLLYVFNRAGYPREYRLRVLTANWGMSSGQVFDQTAFDDYATKAGLDISDVTEAKIASLTKKTSDKDAAWRALVHRDGSAPSIPDSVEKPAVTEVKKTAAALARGFLSKKAAG